MTNQKIVEAAALEKGIYTAEQIRNLYAAGFDLPLYTYATWAARGYQVKKGTHAALSVNLWKMRTGKKTEDAPDDIDPDIVKGSFFLHKVYLFDFRQVEKAAPAAEKTPAAEKRTPAEAAPEKAAAADRIDPPAVKQSPIDRRIKKGHGGRPPKYDIFDREKDLRQAATYILDYNWSLKKTAENMGISASTISKWIHYDLEFIDFDLYSDVISRLEARKIC